MPKHILILSAAVGAGHLRAAQAVEEAARRLAPEALVKNVDVLTLTNAPFRKIYGEAYLEFVNKAPHALGYFYDYLDKPPRTRNQLGDRVRRAWEKLNLQPFFEFLRSEPWDVVVHTHFLPAEIIASLKRKRKLHTPQVVVTTDFETHRLWVNEPTELYTTATEEGKRNLESWGVAPERIAVTGIPIHPVFSDEKDRAAVLKKHGLKGDRPVVLQLAGGFGVGPIEKIYTAIQEVNRPLDIVIVCGKNAKAKERVEKVPCAARHRCKTIGFTTEMDELMCAADVVVTKPGGLTTSEALARGCAMMIVNPIPGQESRNSDFLLENGAAMKANNLSVLGYKLTRLLEDPGRLEAIKASARRLARPAAAADVARRALALS